MTGYDTDAFNIAIGYDVTFDDNTLVGITGGYSQIDVDQNRSIQSEEEIDILNVTAYASHKFGPWFANGQIGYSNASVDTARNSGLENGDITGSFDTNGFNVQGQVGYDFDLEDRGYISPLLGIHWGNYSSDDHTEQGGLNLEIEGADVTYVEGKAGFIAGNVIDLAASQVNIFARANYVVDFDGDVDNILVGFGDGQVTSLEALQGDDERVELGAGATWRTREGLTVGFEFDAEAANDYRSLGGFLRIKYKL